MGVTELGGEAYRSHVNTYRCTYVEEVTGLASLWGFEAISNSCKNLPNPPKW